MAETWKNIDRYEGLYLVSSLGRIKSLPRPRSRRHLIMRTRLLKGYPGIKLCKGGRAKHTTIHALVAHAFIGPRPKGFEVNHKNGVKTDNRATNLEYVTSKQNKAHASENGLAYVGELNSSAKLDEAKVREIRSRYIPWRVSARFLAVQFGVTKASILSVVNRKTWRHVC